MAMDLRFLIGAEDATGAATESARKNVEGLNKAAEGSGSVFDRVFTSGGAGASGFVGKLASISAQFIAIKFAVEMVGEAVVGAFSPGIEAVENFIMSVTKMSALITSFKGGDNLAQTYKEAKEYSTALVSTLEKIDAQTIASAEDLGLMTEEMIKQRIVLDVNNQKQIEGFQNIANAAMVVASGAGNKELQIRQEIRALMSGDVKDTATLATQIDAMVGGGLKQKVALWKEEGTLIENIGKALQGYAAAQGDISATWGAVKSTMESLFNAILRSGFQEVFKDLVGFMDDLNSGAKENAELIGNKIQQAWLAVKGVGEMVVNLFHTFRGPLGIIWEVTKGVLEGWGLLLYAVLPPLTDRMSKLGQAIWEDIKMFGNLAMMILNGLSFNWSAAVGNWEDAKANFAQGGKLTGQAFSDGLVDEIAGRAGKFLALDLLKAKTPSTVKTPDLGKAPVTEEERKAIGGAASALSKYSDAIKEVGKGRLALASEQFNDDLKRQGELLEQNGRIFGNLRGPVNSYLELITSVQEEQTKMEKSVGSILEALEKQRGGKDGKGKLQADLEKAQEKHQLTLLQIERAGAEERLKVWSAYYDNLKSAILKKEKEIEALSSKMVTSRGKIADAIAANNKTLQDPGRALDAYEARLKAKDEILQAINKASKGDDLESNLKALDDLIGKAQELAAAVTIDGQDVISKVDAVNQSNELLRMIGEASDRLHQQAIDTAQKDVDRLKSEMKTALDNVKDIRREIEDLDDRISRMQSTITLVADDKVSPVLDKIKAQIDALRSSSISVSAGYVPSFPTGGISIADSPFLPDNYAGGTSYVPRTGLYQLHQGEEVKTRGEVSRRSSSGGSVFQFGDVNLSFPNVRKEADGRAAARQFYQELKTIEGRQRA